MRILFAAPDRDLLECYKKILEDGFAQVVTAFDGTQVISLISGEPFDIVILDKNIPRIDHKKLTERIQAAGIPAIAISDSPVGVHELTGQILPNALLCYPFAPGALRAEISEVLDNISSGLRLNVGDIEINVSGYCITGGPRLTAGEIRVLRALLGGGTVTAGDGAYISALNLKFAAAGYKERIKYKAKKGFEPVTGYE